MTGRLGCDLCGHQFEDGETVQARTLAVIQRQGHDDDGPFADDGEWLGTQCLSCDSPGAGLPEKLHLPTPNIHIIMTRADGSEEGNQWRFDGDDDNLYDLFEAICLTATAHQDTQE